MMVLYHITAKEIRVPFPGYEIMIYRPALNFPVRCIQPVLSDTGCKHRMFYIKQKDSAGFQRSIYFLKDCLQVFHIMQGQIGNDTIPLLFRILIFIDPTDTIGYFTAAVSFLRLFNHFSAQIDSQNPGSALLLSKSAMPSVPASQVKKTLLLKRREQRF